MKIVLISRPKLYVAIRTLKKKDYVLQPLFERSKEYLLMGRLYKRYTYRLYSIQIEVVRTARKLYTDRKS